LRGAPIDVAENPYNDHTSKKRETDDVMKKSAKNLPTLNSARMDSQRSGLSNYKTLK